MFPRIPAHAHAHPNDEQTASRLVRPYLVPCPTSDPHYIICPILCPHPLLFPSTFMTMAANPSLGCRSSLLTIMDAVPDLRCSVDLSYPRRICYHRAGCLWNKSIFDSRVYYFLVLFDPVLSFIISRSSFLNLRVRE